MNEGQILQMAQGGQVVSVTPQVGMSRETASATIPAVAEQIIKRQGKDEVVVNGPMIAGRTPDSVPMQGSTFSAPGAPVESYLTFYVDGTASVNSGLVKKVQIFDAFGNNACDVACQNQGLFDANMRIFGDGGSQCDSLQQFGNKLKAGFAYDFSSIRIEDITPGNVTPDMDYTIKVIRSNFNGDSTTSTFRIGELISSYQQNPRLVTGTLSPSNARVDGDTAWQVPVKAGRKLKITLSVVKRYQNV